jgi:hypothetical protein
VLRCEGAMQELAHGWPLHDLSTAVARHATEAVGAVDDVAEAMLSVGHHETTICN